MLKFYFDEHMPRAVEQGLVKRGYTVIMAVDIGMTEKPDPEHLQYAARQNAVLFTRDKPFATKTLEQPNHAGLICWTGEQNDFGGMIRRLIEFAEQYTPEQTAGRVFWLK